ncbi:MAG: hypothetical protein HOV81_02005 [Kofleriaceae bacterium]|nr:hypothetical protein [Kofleriaceae bacterium]
MAVWGVIVGVIVVVRASELGCEYGETEDRNAGGWAHADAKSSVDATQAIALSHRDSARMRDTSQSITPSRRAIDSLALSSCLCEES